MKHFLLTFSVLVFLPLQSGSGRNQQSSKAEGGEGERALEEIRDLRKIKHLDVVLDGKEDLLRDLRADLDSVRATSPN